MTDTGFFSDLDNTLIFSARHLLADGPEVSPIEFYMDGRRGGYMTHVAHRLLEDISQRATFIPVTARHTTQFNRLQLQPFRIEHAVLGNGAIMRVDGKRLTSWDSHIRARTAQEHTAPLISLQIEINRLLLQRKLSYELDIVEDLFCVYILDAQAVPEDLMAELLPVVEDRGYRASLQHRKLHLVPRWLSKAEAMLALADELHLTTRYAAGDAVLDVGMVEAADHGWVASGGEIAAHYLHSDHVTVTRGIGVLAGEQILQGVSAALG